MTPDCIAHLEKHPWAKILLKNWSEKISSQSKYQIRQKMWKITNKLALRYLSLIWIRRQFINKNYSSSSRSIVLAQRHADFEELKICPLITLKQIKVSLSKGSEISQFFFSWSPNSSMSAEDKFPHEAPISLITLKPTYEILAPTDALPFVNLFYNHFYSLDLEFYNLIK